MTQFFCSAASRGRTEPLYGTAPRVRTWLLLEYPGVWWSDAIEESTFSSPVKELLTKIGQTESLHRQLFIRQTYRRSETARCFIVRSSETAPHIVRVDKATCDGPVTSLDDPTAVPVNEPMFLVCTHGNHDKCCAKFGLPVYHALRRSAPDHAWQCSHVGGDRFAGNLLCFPHGIYYGHVTPADVPQLVDSYMRGTIDLKHYRGRCCYPKGVQVAEYFARLESGRLGLNELQFDSVTRGDHWVVRFRGVDGIYEVTFQAREGTTELLTCKAERPNRIERYELKSFRVSEYAS